MELTAGAVEIIACAVLILVSVTGNAVLIYCTWRCVAHRLPTSFVLIFSLAVVHLARNLVVNVMNIVLNAGLVLQSPACKFGRFTATLTATLAVWFTLYLSVFYCVKLYRLVHPLSTAPEKKWRRHHLFTVFFLWVAGMAICCPLLVFGEKATHLIAENVTQYQYSSLLYTECLVNYSSQQLELFYGKIFLVIADLLPLAVLVLVSFRVVLLLWEHKKATYGDIWIGCDATEDEILRASKLVIVMMFLATLLWVSHFVLVHFLTDLSSYYFMPVVLDVLCSGYSAISPYLLLLINYKLKVQLRSLRSFCCPDVKKPIPTDVKKSVSESVPAVASPYN
ncbi:taste receptor type 2 member 1-like [Microcaecilia unicolor]|uniref:Taste receptor type 2 n=1 Tax=Microcaecilia unicolor TaxID=1415580 RepID=A0A6P7X5R7_9AMPH|nr:taste receptor type 2 member 1-like [Microcaecilia unicolor]